MEDGTRQQICGERHLTAANRLHISGFFVPDPHQSSASGPRWGTSVPQTSCAHPNFRAWLRHWTEHVAAWLCSNGKAMHTLAQLLYVESVYSVTVRRYTILVFNQLLLKANSAWPSLR